MASIRRRRIEAEGSLVDKGLDYPNFPDVEAIKKAA